MLVLSFTARDDDLDGSICLLLGRLEGRQSLLQLVVVGDQRPHVHLARGNQLQRHWVAGGGGGQKVKVEVKSVHTWFHKALWQKREVMI